MAFVGSMGRKYMTALTFTVTLSLVMMSCGGTSIVMVLRLTFTSLSMPGMIIISPGPLSGMSLPRRKTTPLSYSFSIFIAANRK